MNIIKNRKILCTLFSISIIILINTTSYAETNKGAFELLTRDLSSSIHSLPSKKKFYHYFSLNNGYISPNKRYSQSRTRFQLASNLAYDLGHSFWNLNYHSTRLSNAGPGLYLALDPFISSPEGSKYTGANFGESMLEMTFNPDVKYISVTKKIKLEDDTIEALISEGILTKRQILRLIDNQYFTQDTLKYMVEPQYYIFRKLVQLVFLNLDIILIEYEWQSALELFCNKSNTSSAMVYIGDRGIGNSIESNLLVYFPGFSKKVKLTKTELNSLNKNKKLREVLRKLLSMEKKSEYKKASKFLQSSYANNKEELNLIKQETLHCPDDEN